MSTEGCELAVSNYTLVALRFSFVAHTSPISGIFCEVTRSCSGTPYWIDVDTDVLWTHL